jgi:16S rRNA (guanine(966)-N(2))-methyltransferase RsmD
MMDKVRAALFDMLWHVNAVRGRMLDLYSGTGAVGIEALSRGAEFADLVEANPVSARTIQGNLDKVGFTSRGRVHRRKVEDIVAKPSLLGFEGPFDLISVTPPYAEVDYADLARRVAESSLIGEGTVVVFEHPRGVEMADEIGPLVRLRERRYGGTRISIYEVPYENARDDYEEDEDEDEDEDYEDEDEENDEDDEDDEEQDGADIRS